MASTLNIFRACTIGPLAAATGDSSKVFFAIEGSATKRIVVRRITLTCPTTTAVEFTSVLAQKLSTATTGGTATALTKVPLMSAQDSATANTCKFYTAADATKGTLVGTVASRRFISSPTTAVATSTTADVVFDFRSGTDNQGVALDGVAQGLVLVFGAAPGAAVTMCLEVEWSEEG